MPFSLPLISQARAMMRKQRQPEIAIAPAAAAETALRDLAEGLQREMSALRHAVQAERSLPVTVEDMRNLPQHELDRRFRLQACFWRMADHVGLCRTMCGRLMFVDTRDFALTPHLITSGFWEIWITQAMARLIRTGMVVADVGANLGYYTVLMAEAVGPEGRVYAFEPNPVIAGLLQQTVAVNGYGGFTVTDMRPASERSGERVHLRVPVGHPMNTQMVDDQAGSTDLIEATTVALDDVLPSRVEFLKIDVEGAEHLVWRGLSNTLDANPNIKIFLEVNAGRLPRPTFTKLMQDIRDKGFLLNYVDTDSEIKPCDEEYVVAQAPDDVVLMLERGPGLVSPGPSLAT